MKKLMIAAAVVCAAVFAQAATYNWTAKAGWVSPDDDAALEGATVYFFDANVYDSATFISALGTEGADVFKNAFATTGAVDGDGMFFFSGNGMTDDGNSPAYAKGYAVIVAQDASGKDFAFLADGAAGVKITEAIIGGSAAVFNFDDIITGEVGGAGWAQVGNVPEPTSGLLLLLGVAGLALRRRRA